MKRLSDKKFIEMKPDMDKVVAIRIKNGDFYFKDKARIGFAKIFSIY